VCGQNVELLNVKLAVHILINVFLDSISAAPTLSRGYECFRSTYQNARWHETKQEYAETHKNEAGRSENRGLILYQDQTISPLDKSWAALRPIHCTGLDN
jgi:hypothetical protein